MNLVRAMPARVMVSCASQGRTLETVSTSVSIRGREEMLEGALERSVCVISRRSAAGDNAALSAATASSVSARHCRKASFALLGERAPAQAQARGVCARGVQLLTLTDENGRVEASGERIYANSCSQSRHIA